MVDWDYQNTFCSCWVWLAYKRLGVSRLVVLSCSTRIILLIVKHIRCGIEGSYFLLFCYWLLILLIASLALIILLLQDTPLWAYLLTYCVVNNLLRWVKDCKNFVRRRLLISVAKESLPCSLLLLYCKQRMEDWKISWRLKFCSRPLSLRNPRRFLPWKEPWKPFSRILQANLRTRLAVLKICRKKLKLSLI